MTKVQSSPKVSILYVDDDLENLESFKAVFRRDYDIHLANSAQEALEILEQKAFQVLITDQRMPEMTGSQMLETLGEHHPDMLRFMLTGFSDFDPLVQALNEGKLQGYLSKPLDVDKVKDRIEKGLAKYYLKKKNEALNESLRKSEQQVKLQLAELKQIYEATPVGLILVDREYRIMRINEKLAEIDGASVADHIGKSLDEVIPDLADTLKRIIQPVLENGEPVTNVAIHGMTPKAPGVERDWLCSYYPFKDNHGTILGVVGGIVEVTELKQAEEKARKALQFTHDLMETANVMIVGLDKEGCVQVANPMVESITGYAPGELISKNWLEQVMPKDTYPYAWKEFVRLMDDDLPREFETPIRTKDGEERIIAWSNSKLVEGGTVAGTLFVGIDITQRKTVEKEHEGLTKQLRHAQKMEAIGTLAGGIAHDFNNILSPIIGYAEIIMSESEPSSNYNESAEKILKAGIRASDLVNQILTFSREKEREKKSIKIQPVITEALKLLRATLPTTIELSQNIDNNCGPILGDPTQIYQVVMNLCTNAFQAMQDQGGQIEINAREILITANDDLQYMGVTPGPHVRVLVSDTGPGMEPEILEHIFDPFFTTKRAKSGTGLGLSVVHGIIKGHSGAIKAYSEPGQGSTFSVYLPRLTNRKARPAIVETKDTIVGGTEALLFIDDEEAIVTVTKSRLERLGYQVTGLTDGRKALAIFRKNVAAFDLIISDLTMPDISGVELAQAALLERPDMPIILCSGFSEVINSIKVAKSGIRRVITKPILLNEIAKTIREVLDSSVRSKTPDYIGK